MIPTPQIMRIIEINLVSYVNGRILFVFADIRNRGQVFVPPTDNVPEAMLWKLFQNSVVKIKNAPIMANETRKI